MKKYYKYEMNMTIMNILAIVLIVIPFLLLNILGLKVYEINFKGFFFLGLVGYFILHELLHGLGFFIYAKDKKNIKFGIALEKGVLYTVCQEKISKKQVLVSLLAPTFFLTILTFPLGLLLKFPVLIVYSLLNFSGAIGDILMSYLILKAPKDVEYIDYNSDIGCYLLSQKDLSNYKSFGFFQTETGKESQKQVDKTIKRIYISKISYIILGVLIAISFLNL